MKKSNILMTILLATLGAATAFAQSRFVESIKKQEMIQMGKKGYETRCSGCHGLEGNGNGPGAKMLFPKPRDFTRGVFKFKTVPLGMMPANDDLLKTLNQGVVGTSMPSFALVSDVEKRAIIEYVKTFAPEAWKAQDLTQAVSPLPVPQGFFDNKENFLTHARNGRVWFQELGCIVCHGTSARGDGPSAEGLMDSWDQKITPANLHKRYVKRGYTVQDVAYSIYQGVDGTPMPAYGSVMDAAGEKYPEIKEKKYIWELAAYILYLRAEEAGLYNGEIPAIPEGKISPEEVQKTVGKYFEANN
ncbi:MAG: cytochrome c [Deltaproteobacteria bacterium]|nr:MAG: cytochrome c [Deltaproteobacteria bacterium]